MALHAALGGAVLAWPGIVSVSGDPPPEDEVWLVDVIAVPLRNDQAQLAIEASARVGRGNAGTPPPVRETSVARRARPAPKPRPAVRAPPPRKDRRPRTGSETPSPVVAPPVAPPEHPGRSSLRAADRAQPRTVVPQMADGVAGSDPSQGERTGGGARLYATGVGIVDHASYGAEIVRIIRAEIERDPVAGTTVHDFVELELRVLPSGRLARSGSGRLDVATIVRSSLSPRRTRALMRRIKRAALQFPRHPYGLRRRHYVIGVKIPFTRAT